MTIINSVINILLQHLDLDESFTAFINLMFMFTLNARSSTYIN